MKLAEKVYAYNTNHNTHTNDAYYFKCENHVLPLFTISNHLHQAMTSCDSETTLGAATYNIEGHFDIVINKMVMFSLLCIFRQVAGVQ